MLASAIPPKFDVPFANSASATYKRAVPTTSADPVAASLTNGFPAATFTPTGSGGTAPDGRDFNGILNQLSAWSQWQSAGGPVLLDTTFQTTIGGYPNGAIIASVSTPGKYYRSTVDNNTSNPDTGGGDWTSWTFGAGLTAAVTSLTAGTGLSGGTITSAGTIDLLQASTSQLGGVKVDGTSIIISAGGVISSTTGGGGAVSSVGLALPSIFAVSGSPVTSAGTLTGTLATQTANTIFAGPTAGGAATPTFRALVAADLPVATGAQRGAVQVDGVTLFMTGSVISLCPSTVSIANARANLQAAQSGANADITRLSALADGSAASPAVTIGNVGFYRPSAGNGAFAAGGTGIFSFSASGVNVSTGVLSCPNFRISSGGTVPLTSSAAGTMGDLAFDVNFLYGCTATNTWKRIAWTTF